MPALTATTARTTRRVAWDTITPGTRIVASGVFGRLGCDEGVIEDLPPVTDPAERQWISHLLATDLQMDLAPGEEIGQCHMDLAVVAGDDAVKDADDGYLFCSGYCLREWESEQDAPPARLAA